MFYKTINRKKSLDENIEEFDKITKMSDKDI